MQPQQSAQRVLIIFIFKIFAVHFCFKLNHSDWLKMNHCEYCSNNQNKLDETSVIAKSNNEAWRVDIDDIKLLSESECVNHNDADEKLKELHMRSLLAHIDKSPIKCPISRCSQLIGITSVMRHFLRDHRANIPVDFHECFEGERIGFKFNETMLQPEETICLGVLAYGGTEDDEETRPGKCGLSLTNFMLPVSYSKLIAHMAIAILACKLSLTDLFDGDSLSSKSISSNNTFNDIVVIWLAASETTRKVHCTVTAFTLSSSRSAIMEIQNLKSTNPKQFLDGKSDFLILNRGDLNIFSDNKEKSIEVEISIQEIKPNRCGGG